MISYSTNWMGPITLKWYEDRGLDPERDRMCCGRIDIYGSDSDYPEEMALPMMPATDWYRFSNWLETVRTDNVLTLDELVQMYEQTNPAIRWWKNDS